MLLNIYTASKKHQSDLTFSKIPSKCPQISEKASIWKESNLSIATPKPWVAGSNPPAPAMMLGRNRSDREKKRKAEISRDFSAFFAPNFFRIYTDPFSFFLRVEGIELPKTRFFKNWIRNTSDRKDLNPRQGFKFFRFFAFDTKCLQIVRYKNTPSLPWEDPNPRNG